MQSAVALAGTAAVTVADEPKSTTAGRMKVGCLSWCFHDFSVGVDPCEAIDAVGSLGFDGIELIANGREDFKNVYDGASLDRIRSRLDKNKLVVSQFVLFQPVVSGLASPDMKVRGDNIDAFENGCRIASKLGAQRINIVSPWPTDYGADRGYLPRFYEIANPKKDDVFHITIADGFDWNKAWKEFVETARECARRAAALDLKMTIEHHTHCLVHDATAFLHLVGDVKAPNLGYNLDAGWTQAQREYPPLAIHKIGPHLMNVHMRDIDGLMHRFPPFGTGVMDVKGIVEAARKVSFNGFFSIEQDKGGISDMREVCARYLKIMREAIG